ncbi:CoA-binding protein [Ornithinimicrobium sp. F0845]|uniref:CoA-binding protein n=1 Tax=Ornithinimicrobium sp. F0845 TaxID=2926412 RepID=UPI001FF1271D|nr:CoA-binding protein [Ornithinimicrobium sp. F0845]MCK0111435.1 CoA-binding protein [Ornithinimicrobium sp. F0845]
MTETRRLHRNDDTVITRLLHTTATWAVVGLSANTSRSAYGVARFLQETLGHQVIPVHPRAEHTLGEAGYASLSAIPDGTTVDVVDCFVNSARVGAVVDEAIDQAERLGIKAIWLQLGVVDQDAAQRAKEAGLSVVMDTCPKIEYSTPSGF